ncbi:MAG: LemA family protein [Bradyrhizobium sp.]
MHTEGIAIAVVVLAVITVIVIFNRLVRGRNLVREAWSGIDVQLRRRSDLVPNLVETVKSYAVHERALFAEIAARRTSAMSATGVPGKAAAETDLQGSLHRLLAVAEAYPELKASQNFIALQRQLADLEDQLQMARRYYNGTVRDYNIAIQTVPDVLIAGLAGFREENFFQADEAVAATPSVSFEGRT